MAHQCAAALASTSPQQCCYWRGGDGGKGKERLRIEHSRLRFSARRLNPRSSQRDLEIRVESKELGRLPTSVDYIASPSSAYIKHLVRLRQNPKARSAAESVLVVGTVPLREICEMAAAPPVDVLLVREDAAQSSAAAAEMAAAARRSVRVSRDAMSKLSGLESPPELAGVLSLPPTFVAFEPAERDCAGRMRSWCGSSKPRRILVLDGVQDPGNMGTLLRTASAFAWDGVFLLHGCCDPFNDKALRAARGASFRIPIAVGEWGHVSQFAVANEMRLYAGDPQPGALGDGFGLEEAVDGGQRLCLVLGSEGQGLSGHVTGDCVPVGIPMPGNFESLNVAVAGGILMFLLR